MLVCLSGISFNNVVRKGLYTVMNTMIILLYENLELNEVHIINNLPRPWSQKATMSYSTKKKKEVINVTVRICRWSHMGILNYGRELTNDVLSEKRRKTR